MLLSNSISGGCVKMLQYPPSRNISEICKLEKTIKRFSSSYTLFGGIRLGGSISFNSVLEWVLDLTAVKYLVILLVLSSIGHFSTVYEFAKHIYVSTDVRGVIWASQVWGAGEMDCGPHIYTGKVAYWHLVTLIPHQFQKGGLTLFLI